MITIRGLLKNPLTQEMLNNKQKKKKYSVERYFIRCLQMRNKPEKNQYIMGCDSKCFQ